MKRKIAGGCILFILLTVFSGMFVVDEREQVALTRFGKLVSIITEPGLKWKTPFITNARTYPDLIMDWDGQRGQILTGSKTYMYIDTFTRWKIVDLRKFYTTVYDVDTAMIRLDDIIEPATRDIIQKTQIEDIVRSTSRPLGDTDDFNNVTIGRQGTADLIFEKAAKGAQKFGIKLVGFELKRNNYIETVRKKVYDRMAAERNQEAERIKSEGAADVADIAGKRKKELKRILSDANKTAKEIKGVADAQAADIYASSYEIDPDFYDFTKKMEMYRHAGNKGTKMYLTTDSPLWDLVEGL